MLRKSQFAEEQIIKALKEVEAGAKATDVCRRLGVTGQTFYRWKAKFGGIDVSDAKRLKALEEENHKLKLLVAEQLLDVQMLRLAAEWGLIPAAPRIKNVRVPTTPVEFFSFDEARRLVDAAGAEWRTMILVALRTGLRVGELLALRWDDVDLKAGRIIVRRTIWKGHEGPPKSGRDREVPLGDEVLAALKGHRHLKGKTVFCNPDGSMLTAAQCRPPIEAACRKAGLTKRGWHALRHTFASHLAMRGASAKEVQELLGHGSLQMTMRYMHLSPKARRDAVRLLDALPSDAESRHKEGT